MTAVVVARQAKLSHYDAPQNGARNSFTPRLGDTLSKHTRIWKTVGLMSTAGLAVSACGGEDATEASEGGEITIGVFNGWEEGIAASVLWKYVLETEGYTVTLEYADPAPIFSGLAAGDYDFNLDVWKPVTHGAYIEEFEDSMADYGAWNEGASNHLAVNEDAPIDSIDELADKADAFGNTIVGMDPGAGLTQQIENEVIPTYARADFADDFPEVAEWLQNFEMDGETLHSLESMMFFEAETDDYGPIVEEWAAENQEYVESLTD